MYSVDEILSEFRSQYAEPENETVEQDLQQAAPEQGGEVLQEEEKKDDFEEETASWSVRDILRDYRLMTMESRLAEEKIPEENNRTEENLPAPTADWKETEPAQEIKPAFRLSTKPKPKAEAKPESRAEAGGETRSRVHARDRIRSSCGVRARDRIRTPCGVRTRDRARTRCWARIPGG